MTIWFFTFIVKYSNRKIQKNCIQMQDNLCVHIFALKSDITKINMHNKKGNISINFYNDYNPGFTKTLMKYSCSTVLCQKDVE